MKRALFVVVCALLLLASFTPRTTATTNEGRAAKVHIRIQSLTPPRLVIEGELAAGTQTWSFRKSYAGLLALGERVDSLELSDGHDKKIEARKLAPGEYSSQTPATRFRYEVKLDPTVRSEDGAYVSWLTEDRGLLMLGDLLPIMTSQGLRPAQTMTLTFELPASWLVSSVEKRIPSGQFDVADSDSAVFFVGKDLQQSVNRVKGMEFTFVSSGQWAFSSQELLTLAKSIVENHAGSVGGIPRDRALLILSPFPRREGAQRWSAETRGSTVVLLSGLQPAKTAALVQLSMPLTHELFHLWVPNGLALDGNYDWFYEGFTIYQAMRAAQQLNILTFQDLLNAVSRAFDTYSLVAERDKLSLIEASERRWTTNPTLVYQKAMLVAFLYDLTLRYQTRGKRSLADVYREIFREHRPGRPREQGNDAVISALSNMPGMREFAPTYIQKPASFDPATLFARFGLRVERFGMRTRISIDDSLNREQRDLLRGLGYNGETRGAKHSH